MWSFIILPDVKCQALNTKIRLQCFVCVVLNYIVVGCPWPIILGFSFLRSQGNSSFGVLVNIKLARPPITENSLNFGGRLMNFEKLQLYTNLIKSVIDPLFELPFQLTSTSPTAISGFLTSLSRQGETAMSGKSRKTGTIFVKWKNVLCVMNNYNIAWQLRRSVGIPGDWCGSNSQAIGQVIHGSLHIDSLICYFLYLVYHYISYVYPCLP